MKPKQKAEYLLKTMTVDSSIDLWQSKQCALSAVNEIMEVIRETLDGEMLGINIMYWEQVKQEIEKYGTR